MSVVNASLELRRHRDELAPDNRNGLRALAGLGDRRPATFLTGRRKRRVDGRTWELGVSEESDGAMVGGT